MKKILVILGVVLIIFIALAFWIFPIDIYKMNGASMEPTYFDDDYLDVNESVKDFNRGDVIIFKKTLSSTGQGFLTVKRIVGLPGEKVKVLDGKILVNDEILDHNNLLPGDVSLIKGEIEIKLNSNEYFVLGDNHNQSLDSRVIGPVSLIDIIGRVDGELN